MFLIRFAQKWGGLNIKQTEYARRTLCLINWVSSGTRRGMSLSLTRSLCKYFVSQSAVILSVLHTHSSIILRCDSGPVRGCVPQRSSITPTQESNIKKILNTADEKMALGHWSAPSHTKSQSTKSPPIITRYVPTTGLYTDPRKLGV